MTGKPMLPRWHQTRCDACGCSYYETRTEPAPVPLQFLCSECAAFERACESEEAQALASARLDLLWEAGERLADVRGLLCEAKRLEHENFAAAIDAVRAEIRGQLRLELAMAQVAELDAKISNLERTVDRVVRQEVGAVLIASELAGVPYDAIRATARSRADEYLGTSRLARSQDAPPAPPDRSSATQEELDAQARELARLQAAVETDL